MNPNFAPVAKAPRGKGPRTKRAVARARERIENERRMEQHNRLLRIAEAAQQNAQLADAG